MKYAHLVQIADYLGEFKKISSIKRTGDMSLAIEFRRDETLFFDLAKSGSSIYKDPNFTQAKIYQAPFDIVLKKRLNSATIQSVECLKNNRILKFTCTQTGSYKSTQTCLYLEFTGRFTNAIITDKEGVIIEALRHIDNSYRKIEVGEVLKPLDAIEIHEKQVEAIKNFDEFFRAEFARLNERNLANLRAVKIAQIDKKIASLRLNLDALENECELNEQSRISSLHASVLLANLSQIKEHERKFRLKDFNGHEICFNLDSSPKMAANALFAKSKRLRAKAAGVGLERENLNEKIKFYENLLELLREAKSAGELEVLLPRRTNARLKNEPLNENVQSFYIGEFKIALGRNEKGNARLLKDAKKDDIWLHVKDRSSAHVIIKTAKTQVPEEVLNFAARICVNFSANGSGRYEVDYTKRQNVKIKDGASVNYVDFKTIIVQKD